VDKVEPASVPLLLLSPLECRVTDIHQHNGISPPQYRTLLLGPVTNMYKVTLSTAGR